jgi:hypothetical protein
MKKELNLFGKIGIILLASLFAPPSVFDAFGQESKTINLIIEPRFGTTVLDIANPAYYYLNPKDSLQITQLKFYISQIQLIDKKGAVWSEPNSYHLIDAQEAESLKLPLSIPSHFRAKELRFHLGIDSLTSVSGAMGGDLDPMKGMYWAWQSGYINMKLEGRSKLCSTRKNMFQFHIGGYAAPYNSLKTINLDMTESIEKGRLVLDIQKFMAAIDLSKQHSFMSPSEEAVTLAEKMTKIFSLE